MRGFLAVFRMEWAYWRHTRALPFQIFLFFLVGFLVSTSEVIRIAGPATPVYKNAPTAVIQGALAGLLFSLFAVSLFLGRSAARAFEEGLADWEFALPLSPGALFWGRFFGALALSLLVVLMLPVGIEVGVHMPWVDPDKVGPIRLDAHLEALGGFLLPGLFSAAAILYGLAFAFRSHRAAIVGGVGLFFVYMVSQVVLTNLELAPWAFWVDPFGLAWMDHVTRYWTPAELNHRLIPLSLAYGISRLLWAGVPLAWLVFLSRRFRMTLIPERAHRENLQILEVDSLMPASPPSRPRRFSSVSLFLAHLHLALRLLLGSWVFWLLVAIFILATLVNFWFSFVLGQGMYDLPWVPTSAGVLNLMSGNVLALVVLLVVVFAGELFQMNRKMLEWMAVVPAYPAMFLARTWALVFAVVLVLSLFGVMGVITQVILRTPIQWGLYIGWMLYTLASPVIPYAALAVFLHTLVPRKFLVHMVVGGLFFYMAFAKVFGVEKAIFRYGFVPKGLHGNFSDMAGLSAFSLQHMIWLILWGFVACMLLWKAEVFTRLPALEPFIRRLRFWGKGYTWWDRWGLGILGSGILVFAGVMYWQLYRARPWMSQKDQDVARVAYEKRYKHLQLAPVPHLTHITAQLDLFPSRRGYTAHVQAVYVNRDTLPVESLLVETRPSPPYTVNNLTVSRPHTVVDSGVYPRVALWRLSPPLLPGETLVVEADISCQPPLVTDDHPHVCGVLPRTSLVNLSPPLMFGYDPFKELDAKRLRVQYGLTPERVKIPPDTPRADFLGFSRYTFDLTVSLPAKHSQIVVSGGDQAGVWEEKGRRFVRFQGREPATWSMGYLVVAAGPYTKRVKTVRGIRVELYFYPDHAWNADTIHQGALAALLYHLDNFGQYPHSTLRIVEFSSLFGDYAASSAGFILYGETAGFLSRQRADRVPLPIVMIAHEVGHQWWGHQLTPAKVLGERFLTESFAHYVAIRVASADRPPQVLASFLMDELHTYLREHRLIVALKRERPLVFAEEPGIYYSKGSIITHATASLLGHETYAGILRDLLAAFRDPPPHPSVRDYLNLLYARAPSELRPVLRDWHEEVVIYELRAREARREGDTLLLTLEARKFRVEGDSEQAVAFDEPVDVGLFAGDSLVAVRRIWIRDGTHTYSLPSVPESVGRVAVDPFFERINRTWEERETTVK